jgi:hypothetical protein
MTPAANFSTSLANVVDTGGKFPTGANDTSGKFATDVNNGGGKKITMVSTTPATICHRYKQHKWQTMGTIIKLLTF